jgi:hypothetical protein
MSDVDRKIKLIGTSCHYVGVCMQCEAKTIYERAASISDISKSSFLLHRSYDMHARIFLLATFLVLSCGCKKGIVKGDQVPSNIAQSDVSTKVASKQPAPSIKPLISLVKLPPSK